MNNENNVAPNFCVIAIDEKFQYQIEALDHILDKNGFKCDDLISMETIYLFDRNRYVHCCEITPSYELDEFDYRATFTDELELTGEKLDAVRDELTDLMWANSHSSTHYFHVSRIENLIQEIESQNQKFMFAQYSKTPEKDWPIFLEENEYNWELSDGETREAAYEKYKEEVLESVRSNCIV